jgi:hypothetical protein
MNSPMTSSHTSPVRALALPRLLILFLATGILAGSAGMPAAAMSSAGTTQAGEIPSPPYGSILLAPAASDEEVEKKDDSATEPRRRSMTPNVSFGRTHIVVGEDEYHDGDLVLLGGSVEVRGTVTRSLVLIGSRANISGEVNREIVAIASKVELREGARVGRELVNVLGRVDMEENVTIGQEFVNLPFIDLSAFSGGSILGFIIKLILWIKLLLLALLFLAIVIISAIFADRIAFAADVLPSAWGRAFLFGLLVYLLWLVAAAVLVSSGIGAPLAGILWIGVTVLRWLGMAALFCAVGRQFGSNIFGRKLSYFGAILVGFLVYAIVYMIPFMGGIVKAIIGVTGIGLMVITRFGTRTPGQALSMAPVAPPPPPGPPPAAPPSPPGPAGAPPASPAGTPSAGTGGTGPAAPGGA